MELLRGHASERFYSSSTLPPPAPLMRELSLAGTFMRAAKCPRAVRTASATGAREGGFGPHCAVEPGEIFTFAAAASQTPPGVVGMTRFRSTHAEAVGHVISKPSEAPDAASTPAIQMG